MHAHFASAAMVLGIALLVPVAGAAKAASPGLRLECSLHPGGLVTLANQTQTNVAPRTNIELRSSSGQQLTVLAPQRGIPVKGRVNLRYAGFVGNGCTAHTVMLLSQ